MKFSAKNPRLRKAAKRWQKPLSDTKRKEKNKTYKKWEYSTFQKMEFTK